MAAVTSLSHEQLKSNALTFANRWQGDQKEDADAKTFLDEFFSLFGRDRRAIDAHFEHAIKRQDQGDGFIDLFWRGKFLVEMKSTGKNLDKATTQAFDYITHLDDALDVPQYILISDFHHFHLYDLGEQPHELFNTFKIAKKHPRDYAKLIAQFTLPDLWKHLGAFNFIRNEDQSLFTSQPTVNLKAVKLLGTLHDTLQKHSHYTGHQLQRFLVRILFCLFAEDTDIFPWNTFTNLVQNSRPDATNLGEKLSHLFQLLDSEKRNPATPPDLAAFPYINGGLFRERIDIATLNPEQRSALIACCRFDWSQISPAVFGSLFQGVLESKERREKGAHYTSEENILKLLTPLFLHSYQTQLEALRTLPRTKPNLQKIHDFLKTLASTHLLDPACGCGNFLVVAYRELRSLELETLKILYPPNKQGHRQAELSIDELITVSVEQMHGIELDEFPALIAETALWLTDHQINLAVSQAFGQSFLRIPLRLSPHIHHQNALTTPWENLLPPQKCSFILGNPPFIGQTYQTPEQKQEIAEIFPDLKKSGTLDYVTGWHRKATDYMAHNPKIRTAFVSTNSICQGEQVATLWENLLEKGIKIHFAHQTFSWSNEASGKAAVHCIIIGFSLQDTREKTLFTYPDIKQDPTPITAKNINPYLLDAPNIIVTSRTKPLCSVPNMVWGNKPVDGGHLILDETEKTDLLSKEPQAAKWIRPLLGGKELINSSTRYCLWLVDAQPSDLRSLPHVLARIEKVRQTRLASKDKGAQALASRPSQFRDTQNPTKFLAIPRISSERREYVPMAFLNSETIVTDLIQTIPDATLYHLGVLSSHMHMAWMRAVAGRLKSDYRYSKDIVYNNFPWPNPTDEQRTKIETCAQAILDTREKFPTSSLADLYDPRTMPPELRKAHTSLDRAVDAAYQYTAPPTDPHRTAHLFSLYQQLTQTP